LERAANALLSKYQKANRQSRSTPAPSRFDNTWRLHRIPVDAEVPEIILRRNLDDEIKEATELLKREIIAVHKTFEQAVEGYRQIDDIFPEDTNGPAAKAA
jgi:hypothetical protein